VIAGPTDEGFGHAGRDLDRNRLAMLGCDASSPAALQDGMDGDARRDCNMPYPGCRVVRSSMALLRVLPVLVTAWFYVTCGLTPMARRLAT